MQLALRRTVLTTAAFAVLYTRCIERSTNNVVPNAREIGYFAATDQHDGVFLEVVTFARDVSGNFHSIAQANSGHFTKGRIRLLRGDSANLKANAALLRASLFKLNLLVGKCIKRVT